MCGRFTQTKSREEALEELGNIELPPLFHGRYNIAPTQKIAVIQQNQPARAIEAAWGFDSPQSGAPIINARSETLMERPLFKNLVAHHRCLIPTDGFYEWKDRQPYYFQLPDRNLFAFAGLWRNDRCVIITRPADGNMQGIHDRMPVIFPLRESRRWLHDEFQIPRSAPTLVARPVSRRVNSVANDDPTCMETPPRQGELF